MCIVDKAVRDYEKEIRKLKQEHQIQIMDMEARKCDEMDKMKKRILVNER